MFFILDTAERLGFTQIYEKIKPQSPQGKRVKKEIQPFRPGQEAAFDQMTERLTFWYQLWEEDYLSDLLPLLSELRSINGILERLADGESLNEGECFEVKANLSIVREVWEQIQTLEKCWKKRCLAYYQGEDCGCGCDQSSQLNQHGTDDVDQKEPNLAESTPDISQISMYAEEPIFQMNPLDELWDLFNPGQVETDRFYLWDAYDPDLAQIRETKNHLQAEMRQLKKELLAELEQKMGRPIPVSGEIMVSKMDQELLDWMDQRDDLHLQKETFSAIFYKWSPKDEYESLESHVNLLEVEEEQVTRRVLSDLSVKIAEHLQGLRQNQQSLGELDWILAKVAYAHQHRCIPPRRISTEEIRIQQGRHLLVEAEVQARGNEYTSIDIEMSKGVTLITGSNMGGKTLNLRMVGLLIAMAQHGLCVPAARMEFHLREFIYFSVDDDQTKGDLSTFGQEIVGLNQALPRKDEAGLMLIDELARGTNPEEGSALGKAIIRSLIDSNTITVMTTHFSPLTHVQGIRHLKVVGLAQDKYIYLKQQYHQNFSLKLINQLMDYRLEEVKGQGEVSRDAIRVASLLGLDEKIIKDAQHEIIRAEE